MYSVADWTAQEIDILVKQHKGKAFLTCVTLPQAQILINLIGRSRLELRRGKFYGGYPLVDVYIKGFTYC